MEKNREIKKNKVAAFFDNYVPVWARVFYIIALISLAILIISVQSASFADFFNTKIAAYYRAATATISGIVHFSLAEATIILLPLIIASIIYNVIRLQRSDDRRAVYRFFICVFAILSLFFTSFVFTHGTGYHGTTLDVKLSVDKEKVSTEELKLTTEYIASMVNESAKEVTFRYGSFSVMPYGFDELTEKINEAYSKACEQYDFLLDFHSPLKPVAMSEAMSYAHLLGVYTYYTGESNINVNFPDYSLAFTCAHEMSHQRGISREDEANFMAYLVCINSDDAYIRYSGYLNMYEYLMSSLYKVDTKSYAEIYWSLDSKVTSELQAYNNFFAKYEDSVVADISETVNNSFLQSTGQSAGVRSYGMVVDLMVAYYKAGKCEA